ncbi:MAG: FtsX-like permease family protein, partial [Bacillota bacterium]|nr:FtsX-like permease family protein [Bacillota bacterium]
IARAIVNDPDIILADEPTGALDSKTSEQIMDIIKEISKTKLVIMVTHNENIAKKYSDRVIRMLDGVITSDSNPPVETKTEKEGELSNNKTSMSFFTALKNSFKNLITKKGRTVLTSVAGSLGIIGVALISSVSNGFSNYIDRIESSVMVGYPIAVMSSSFEISTSLDDYKVNREKYPDDEKVFVYDEYDTSESGLKLYFNDINEEYINMVRGFEEDGLASSVMVNYMTRSNLITRRPNGNVQRVGNTSFSYFSAIPSGTFSPLVGDEEFMLETYDLIGETSRFPTNINEAVLMIDSYNRISFQTLSDIGVLNTGASTIKEIDFTDLIGKKYKLIDHDDYYLRYPAEDVEVENKFSETGTTTIEKYRVRWGEIESMFNDPEIGIELEIVGILRPKRETRISLLSPGLKYHRDLVEVMKDRNVNSEIGKSFSNNIASTKTMDEIREMSEAEIANALQNVINFYSPFTDSGNPTGTISFQVFLNSAKFYGATFEDIDTSTEGRTFIKAAIDSMYSLVESIAIFPKDANSKKIIRNKMDKYNEENPLEQIKYFDAVSTLTDSLATMVNIVTIVLLVFTSISLVVSGLLIAIITYISVIERTKEIGVLRALGARKKDVTRLFEAETFIIGLIAGLIGVIVAYLITIPLNMILNNAFPGENIGNIADLAPLTAVFLVALNVGLTMLAGLIPSIAAARKNPVEALRTE